MSGSGSDEGFEELPDLEEKDSESTSVAAPTGLTVREEEERAMDQSEEGRKRRLDVMNLVSSARCKLMVFFCLIWFIKKLFVKYYSTLLACATVFDYCYDVNKELWTEITLTFGVGRRPVDMSNVVKKACNKAVIKEVKNIKRYRTTYL